MTIKQLLVMPVGQPCGGGFVLQVKKTKKYIKLGEKKYLFTVVLVDETGEILADFENKVYIPLKKEQRYKIIVAKIQQAEGGGKKLYVEQWKPVVAAVSEPPLSDFDRYQMGLEPDSVVRSKIMCWMVAAYLQSGKDTVKNVVAFSGSDELKEIVDNIMKG